MPVTQFFIMETKTTVKCCFCPQLKTRLISIGSSETTKLLPADYRHNFDSSYAAVLVLFVFQNGKLSVLLTVRHDSISLHPGEVSLPGGGMEKVDTCVADTALREANEEVGLDSNCIQVLWISGPFQINRNKKPRSLYCVYGLIESDFEIEMDTNEVVDIFTAELDRFEDNNAEVFTWNGRITPCVYEKGVFSGKSFRVWGATYRICHHTQQMLSNFDLQPKDYVIPSEHAKL